MIFLILPTQLFDKKYLDKSNQVLIWEHPHYFTKYNYNKKKLILHRASMKAYYQYLKSNNFQVKYLNFDKKLPKLKNKEKSLIHNASTPLDLVFGRNL